MDTGTALLLSEAIKMAIRALMELLAQANMTDEERAAYYDSINEEFEKMAPENLPPAP